MDAEDLLLRQFLGIRTEEQTAASATWIRSNQRDDGTWDEPWFTGTGFPGAFYINYHLYRMVFPLSALGRYLEEEDRRG